MRKLVFGSLFGIAAIYLTAMFLSSVTFNNPGALFLGGLVLALLNLMLRPLLVIISLPLNLITLGLFTLVINTWMVMLTGKLVPGLQVDGFWSALCIALLVSIMNVLIKKIYRAEKMTAN